MPPAASRPPLLDDGDGGASDAPSSTETELDPDVDMDPAASLVPGLVEELEEEHAIVPLPRGPRRDPLELAVAPGASLQLTQTV